MEQGEYKVGLDTLLKILGTFNMNIGEFFEEPTREKSVLSKYRTLSPAAQKEVDSFIEFKRTQEGFEVDTDDEDGTGGSEGEHDE